MRTSILLPAIFVAAGFLNCADSTRADLNDDAFAILKKRCYNCHDASDGGMNVMDRATLVDTRYSANGKPKPRFIEERNPDKSLIWIRISRDKTDVQRMPPGGGGGLPDAEKDTLRKWILAGALFPEAKPQNRPFVSNQDVLEIVRNDLQKRVQGDAPFMRYLTLTHLHNNLRVTDVELRLYRAAMSKAVNALSRKGRIVVPEKVDEWGTVYAIDLRHYGWADANNFRAWRKVLSTYPYGFKLQDPAGNGPRVLKQIAQLSGFNFDGIASIRADWFVAKATRPPLYHILADIPDTLDKLISQTKRQGDFQANSIIRGGVQESRVSPQNRLIDFFPAGPNTRATWISYDFRKGTRRSDILRFPLGPESLVGNNLEPFAFRHAGSEIIFERPNGLHGYMLVDSKGGRIDVGPAEVVRDVNEISGSPLIVNGLSCISCHKHGLIDIEDTLAEGVAQVGLAQAANEKLRMIIDFKGNAAGNKLSSQIEDGRDAYLRKLKLATAQFLQQGPDANKSFLEFPEPISAVVRRFDRELDLNDVATELGYARKNDPNLANEFGLFTAGLQGKELGRLGLRILLNGGRIKRGAWESREDDGDSVLQEAARVVMNASAFKELDATNETSADNEN